MKDSSDLILEHITNLVTVYSHSLAVDNRLKLEAEQREDEAEDKQ